MLGSANEFHFCECNSRANLSSTAIHCAVVNGRGTEEVDLCEELAKPIELRTHQGNDRDPKAMKDLPVEIVWTKLAGGRSL